MSDSVTFTHDKTAQELTVILADESFSQQTKDPCMLIKASPRKSKQKCCFEQGTYLEKQMPETTWVLCSNRRRALNAKQDSVHKEP